MLGILTRISSSKLKILWIRDMSVTDHHTAQGMFLAWDCVSEDMFNHLISMKTSLLLLDPEARKETICTLIAEQQAKDKPNE